MKLRRKMLVGAAVLVVAVPVGAVTALLGPSLIASAGGPQDPVMCNLSGGVTFSPPLTYSGDNTGKGSTETVTLNGLSLDHCLSSDAAGAPSSGSIPNQNISIPATKVGAGKSAQYLTGYCPAFGSAASLKALKGLSLTTTWSGGAGGTTTVTTKTPDIVSNNSGEDGFAIVEKYGSGSYAAKVAQTIAYVTSSSVSAIAACDASASAPAVSSITFDSATSTAIQ